MGSIAVALAERGRPSIEDSSPTRSPGPHTPSTTSRPCSRAGCDLDPPVGQQEHKVRTVPFVEQSGSAPKPAHRSSGLQEGLFGRWQQRKPSTVITNVFGPSGHAPIRASRRTANDETLHPAIWWCTVDVELLKGGLGPTSISPGSGEGRSQVPGCRFGGRPQLTIEVGGSRWSDAGSSLIKGSRFGPLRSMLRVGTGMSDGRGGR